MDKHNPIPDSSSDDEIVPQYLKTTEEEIAGTVPYSPQADAAAFACGTVQANPTVPRGLPRRVKRKTKVSTATASVQTETTTSTPPVSPVQSIQTPPQRTQIVLRRNTITVRQSSQTSKDKSSQDAKTGKA